MHPIARSNDQEDAERPYPLVRRFLGIGGPVFALFLIALVVGSVFAVRRTVENVYLQLAQQRAGAIAADVSSAHPQEWQHLFAQGALSTEALRALTEAFAGQARAFHLDRLKVYDIKGRTLFSMIAREIGTLETGDALQRVLRTQAPGLDQTTDPDGNVYYELYVPYFEAGGLTAVLELYEPISSLDVLLLRAAGPAALVPFVLLSLLVVVLFELARRAQRDIEWRTARIADLTKRVERLVSRRAVQAMRGAKAGGPPEPRLIDCTLLFSDVRGFTVFSERSTPSEVIVALNRAIAVQVEVIEQAGGDVDKFIGDAVFARFEGPDRGAAAIQAAIEIQRRFAEAALPLSIGIGIASGSVVAGAIGAADRYDYTVLGDAVNVAARLSSAARGGEVVVDQQTAAAAHFGAGAPEAIIVKGRAAAVPAVRIASPAGAAPLKV